MSDSTLHSTNSAENDFADNSDFEFSDYLFFDEWLEENPASLAHGFVQGSAFSTMNNDDSGKSSSQHGESSSSKRRGSDGEKSKKDDRAKVAFKIKSELDVLDDGFKWRKYGKKMVKNSPNPRNYYRCSVEGCPVKKRVERDAGDPQYVITTYEGIHTHESPSL